MPPMTVGSSGRWRDSDNRGDEFHGLVFDFLRVSSDETEIVPDYADGRKPTGNGRSGPFTERPAPATNDRKGDVGIRLRLDEKPGHKHDKSNPEQWNIEGRVDDSPETQLPASTAVR